ncbi:hypothetical protein G9X43_06605 [Cronobacter turicensis]|uniref:hypothetical protein n=1 Tax=Cronobacter turicensis TaxID=413502 RepID=UPI00141250B5|nr:hypothetical protein [Cronobacter turicensis]NHV08538.1 hypothetical protein [Cronobacter turicensis]NHV62576.1 hypothetical protein [Cronobacter turicensis]NHW09517.1 hypothetical protein [Cronobacter turicensis]
MKKALSIIAVALMLSACDDQPTHTAPSKPTVAQMIANGTEEYTFDCKKGSFTTNCEILSGDQQGSGKWHHATIYISKEGQVDIKIDGEAFYQHDVNNSFFQGTRYSNIIFKGVNGNSAKVTLSKDNDGTRLSMEGYNKDAKRFMLASTKF